MSSNCISCWIYNCISQIVDMNNYFSQRVTVFHNRNTPELSTSAGYALLIEFLLKESNKVATFPSRLVIVTDNHYRYNTDQWQVFTTRNKPNDHIIS